MLVKGLTDLDGDVVGDDDDVAALGALGRPQGHPPGHHREGALAGVHRALHHL